MQFSETGRESLFEAGGGRMMSFLAGAGDGHARSGHADGEKNPHYRDAPVTSISSDKHLRPGFLREAKHLRPGFL